MTKRFSIMSIDKFALCLCFLSVFILAKAQDESQTAIRIGFILPAIHEGDMSDPLVAAVAEGVLEGATMAKEEFGFNAQLLGYDLVISTRQANDVESARLAAEQLYNEENVFAIAGGYGTGVALALSQFAAEEQLLFLNIASSSDSLRNETCSSYSFHLEPSAGMYLDAIAGWFIRSQFRNWFFIYEDSVEGEARYERIRWSLRNRHFGAREAGKSAIATGTTDYADSLEAIRRARPDVVLMLLEHQDQLSFLAQYDAEGLEAMVTGYPTVYAQTRAFYAALRQVAPERDAFRASAWEATLDAYGARELNNRYAARWDKPMDAAGWAGYQAVKLLFETATFGGSLDAEALVDYLERETTVFDIWKGIGVTFRNWDHQLRQPLYLISVTREAENDRELALLVGELPAIYMPQTDPTERLDQLGDVLRESECRFN